VKTSLSLRRVFPLVSLICLAALALPWVAEPIHRFFLFLSSFLPLKFFLFIFGFLGKIFWPRSPIFVDRFFIRFNGLVFTWFCSFGIYFGF
jgi:hypothetical protein